jgi:hypothetical protein
MPYEAPGFRRGLVAAIRAATGSKAAALRDWSSSATDPGARGVLRIRCRGDLPSGERHIVNLVYKSDGGGRQSTIETERAFYQSRFGKCIPKGMQLPALYHVATRSGRATGLFLEDLTTGATQLKTSDDYVFAAGVLGRFNGEAAPPGNANPVWMRKFDFEGTGTLLAQSPTRLIRTSLWRLVARTALFANRWRQLTSLLPQCVSHNDPTALNLLLRRRPKTLLVFDWEHVGAACVGSDLSALVGGSLFLGEGVDALSPSGVSESLAAYCTEVDRHRLGSESQAYEGYALCSGLRCLRRARFVQALAQKPALRVWWRRRFHESATELFRRFDSQAEGQIAEALRISS